MINLQKNRLLKLSLIVIWLFLTILPILHTNSETNTNINPVVEVKEPTPTLEEIIQNVSHLFNQDPKLIKKIIYCESEGKISNHDNGKGFNVTGIHDTTFNYWLKSYQKENGETLDINSTYDQIKMMSWAFSQGDSYRNQWTTYVAYINGGSYTFYNSESKKYLTARCN